MAYLPKFAAHTQHACHKQLAAPEMAKPEKRRDSQNFTGTCNVLSKIFQVMFKKNPSRRPISGFGQNLAEIAGKKGTALR